MTRISAKLVRQARRLSPYLPPLLIPNRSINQALLELKWIKSELPKSEWKSAVNQRLKLVPLQYILKTQPFGNLNILCKKDVLIPRWETEEWTIKLIEKLKLMDLEKLTMIDACTGTGCIPLLVNEELKSTTTILNLHGIDISGKAFNLANENSTNHHLSVKFHIGDIFDEEILNKIDVENADLITSNPPYIPLEDYSRSVQKDGTARSVKLYEPKLALIGNGEFYYNILKNIILPSNARGFIFEVGYLSQADFVNDIINSDEWMVGYMNDSADKIRCVLGWKPNTEFEMFRDMCDYVYK